MPEPQIPGMLQGYPAEGRPGPIYAPGGPGYVEGPTPNMAPYAPAGNPSVNPIPGVARQTRISQEWRW